MRNPNGYGTVARLTGRRRRPFIVKKVARWKENGQPVYSVIGYAETREAGNMLLAEYNRDPWDVDRAKLTLQQLFDLWKEKKAPKLGESNRSSLCSAFKHCSTLAEKPYKQIKSFHMQDTIDGCGKGYSTQAAIKNLWGHLDRFALELDIITRCYSELLTSDPIPETSRQRFSDEEIAKLWEHQAEPWVDTVLIFIYSGWRISELLALTPADVDLQAGTMTGGTKTKAGKNRVVPIHSKIRPLVEARLAQGGPRLITSEGRAICQATYRNYWAEIMARLGMAHVPHECRHTFESLLDSAGANRKCIDLLMGHVSKDTGNRVYNHKTIEELRLNIELITR
jgi:Site-specific recombinase XerD